MRTSSPAESPGVHNKGTLASGIGAKTTFFRVLIHQWLIIIIISADGNDRRVHIPGCRRRLLWPGGQQKTESRTFTMVQLLPFIVQETVQSTAAAATSSVTRGNPNGSIKLAASKEQNRSPADDGDGRNHDSKCYRTEGIINNISRSVLSPRGQKRC